MMSLLLVLVLTRSAQSGGLDGVHRNFALPTGELVPAGEVRLTQFANLLTNGVTWGVTEGLEIDAVALPWIVGGQVQARVGVLPRSSDLRLVLGVGVAGNLLLVDGPLATTSITGAYQGRTLNVHATAMTYYGRGTGTSLRVASAGATWMLGKSVALGLDAVRLLAPHRDCEEADKHRPCQTWNDTSTVINAGIKFFTDGGKIIELNATMIEELSFVPLPIITITHIWN